MFKKVFLVFILFTSCANAELDLSYDLSNNETIYLARDYWKADDVNDARSSRSKHKDNEEKEIAEDQKSEERYWNKNAVNDARSSRLSDKEEKSIIPKAKEKKSSMFPILACGFFALTLIGDSGIAAGAGAGLCGISLAW